MLGPILQAVWQQIGPAFQQAVTFALPYLRRIPPPVYINAGRTVSKEISGWYNSLDTTSRKKVDDAITWVTKDLLCDVAFAYTGLQFKPLVDKVFELVGEHQDNPEARAYINDELVKRIESNKQSQKTEFKKHSLPDGGDMSIIADKDLCPCGSGKRYENCHGLMNK
jgi:hypothetical protein